MKGEKKKIHTWEYKRNSFLWEKYRETLVITAGVHGGEYVGIETALRLIKELEAEKLSGNIVICPVLNTDGFYDGVKQISTSDYKNLNREFPGDEKGTSTQRMAFDIEKYLLPDSLIL